MFKFQKEKCTQETEGKVIKTHKLGKIPVGMRSKVSLGNVSEGDHIRIYYNAIKPKRAYMPDNSGLLLM